MDFVILDAVYRQHLEEQRVEGRAAAQQENRARFRQLRDNSNPFEMNEGAFKGMYRLSKELAQSLIEELQPFIGHGQRTTAIPVELKVLCALHFYAQGSYQKGVGSDNALAMRQSSVSRSIDEVTEALNQPQILTEYVSFPLDADQRRALQQRNYRSCRIPGVLGFVDGTHIAITKPKDHEELYVNRKGYHSINAQMVCDTEYNILNVVARYNGSAHDSYIWSNSSVRRFLENLWQQGERLWLLGDSGYPLEPWLHTPILDAAPGSPEEQYTSLHLTARSTVERCIGILKNRFRCLLKHRVLHYAPHKAGRIVNACCVLHNKCLRANRDEYLPREAIEEPEGAGENIPDIQLPFQGRQGNPVFVEGFRTRANVVARVRNQ